MQIWKFINMEPPSAAAYFFHLRASFALLHDAFQIHLYSATFIIGGEGDDTTHWRDCPACEDESLQTMCRLWGYQCVPFIVLCHSEIFRYERKSMAKKVPSSGNSVCEILSISSRTCIMFFIAPKKRLIAFLPPTHLRKIFVVFKISNQPCHVYASSWS